MAKNDFVSLNDFIGFLNKTGKQRQNHVKQLKNRPEYEKQFDFYAPFREKVQKLHQEEGSKEELDALLKGLTDEKKRSNYPSLIDGYKKFLGRKGVKWFKPPKKDWNVGDIAIRINPELGLEYNGKFYVIKLYCKEDIIRKDQIDQILALMELQLRHKIKEPEIQFAFLNIRKNKLSVLDLKVLNEIKDSMLIEAKTFNEYWKAL
jgi:acyl-CoA-binding protein